MFKVIRYDLRFGIYESMRKYLLITLFGALVSLCFLFDAVHMSVRLTGSPGNIKSLPLSMGDVILFELGSQLPSDSLAGLTRLSFPTMWFLLNILPLYITLNYTTHDLGGCGIQVLTRLRSKKRWWLSKCVLSMAFVVTYYAVIYLFLAALCLASGFDLSLIPDETLFSIRFSAVFLSDGVTEFQMFLALCVMPCIVTAALSLAQMMLTLFIQPVFAYIAACAYVVGSVLCVHPAFITNFAMPIRSSAVGIYDFDFASGLVYSALIATVAIVIGAVRISRMDIIQGGKS